MINSVIKVALWNTKYKDRFDFVHMNKAKIGSFILHDKQTNLEIELNIYNIEHLYKNLSVNEGYEFYITCALDNYIISKRNDSLNLLLENGIS